MRRGLDVGVDGMEPWGWIGACAIRIGNDSFIYLFIYIFFPL